METISKPKIVKARKNHRCCYCSGEILLGLEYETATYKIDEIYTWKNHIHCGKLPSMLKMEKNCEGAYDDERFAEDVIEECKIRGFENACYSELPRLARKLYELLKNN